jgi:hypothetical protein
MAPIAPEKSNFFVRCNYDVGKPGEGAQGRQDQAIKGAAKSLLALVAQAIVRIEQGDRGEAALRELWASLVETPEFEWPPRTSMRLPPPL